MPGTEHAAAGPASRAALRYALAFAAAWLTINLALYAVETSGLRQDPAGTLTQKMSFFAHHAADYDLVFVGDSRTYCAMHPDLIDPRLGTHSINLARWANWFPTQYPQFQDLMPLLEDGTVVVWSIGRQNFRPIGERLHTAYPVGLANVPYYLGLGFPPGSLTDNLLFNNPTTTLVGWLPQLRSSLDARLDRDVWRDRPDDAPARPTAASIRSLLDKVEAQAETARWELRVDDGITTSLAVQKKNGAYERFEIDHEYFRRKQRENAVEVAARVADEAPFEPAPEYWRLFLAMLDLFEQHGVRLVVNELEEAPYVYLTDARRWQERRFMHDRVAPEVRRRGFDYIRVDFDRLTDEDYFDYNHLNSRGIEAYTELIVHELRGTTVGLSASGGR